MKADVALLALIGIFAWGCGPTEPTNRSRSEQFSVGQFEELMEELAAAWNSNDARRAVACFTEDAVYLDPPDKLLFRGQDELFEFFGGDEGRPKAMTMVWHHLVYDAETAIGMGEFTFAYGTAAHGVVVVKIRDGRIANWREYWYESELSWHEFVQRNPF